MSIVCSLWCVGRRGGGGASMEHGVDTVLQHGNPFSLDSCLESRVKRNPGPGPGIQKC